MLNAEKSRQDLTVCRLCDQQYTDPRILPCLHTFCLQCLQKRHLSFADTTASCAECGGKYAGPLADLPRNSFIQKLIRINRIANVAVTQQTPCDVCQQDDSSGSSPDPSSVATATHYCPKCAESLCGKSDLETESGSPCPRFWPCLGQVTGQSVGLDKLQSHQIFKVLLLQSVQILGISA